MGRASAHPWRRAAALVAAGLLVLGVLATAVRLDAPADPGLVRLGWSAWQADGVVVDVGAGETRSDLRGGEVVTAVAGHPLTDPPGGVARPSCRGGAAVHGGRRRTPGHHAAAGAAGPAARRLGQPRLRAGPRRAGPGALRPSSRGAGDVGLAGRRVRSVRQHPGRRCRAARAGPRDRRPAALALPPGHQRGVPGGLGRHGGDGPAADPGPPVAAARPAPGAGQRVRRSGRGARAVGGSGWSSPCRRRRAASPWSRWAVRRCSPSRS